MSAAETPALEWLSAKQAGIKAGRHPQTIRKACAEWERTNGRTGLRGSQQGPNCSWRIHVDDLKAWMYREKPPSTRGRHLGRVS